MIGRSELTDCQGRASDASAEHGYTGWLFNRHL